MTDTARAVDRLDHEDVGYLTMHEFNRFRWAWDNASKVIGWLQKAGRINSSGETDIRVDSSSAPSTPLEATWLAADEIQSHLYTLNRFHEPEQAANDRIGQYHAIELGRCVSGADRRWPQQDKPHRIRHMRCGGCEELTLTYRPPRFPLDGVIVNCWCGYTLTEDEWTWAVSFVEAELLEAA